MLFSAATAGFNNHPCTDEYYSWGWLPAACYNENITMIQHTKEFPEHHPNVKDVTCPALEAVELNKLRPGTLVVLPGVDMPCYLEDKECRELARPYLTLPPEEGEKKRGEEMEGEGKEGREEARLR